jgi:hypothetical protein
MTLGYLTFRHENGPSFNVLDAFHLPVQVMLLPSSMMLCTSLVGVLAKPAWMICLPLGCRVSEFGVFNSMRSPFTYDIRWFKYQNIGASPSKRWLHAMASDGTRVFVLGGKLSEIARGDETAFIHVLDTSTFYLLVISFGQFPSLKSQSTQSTRIQILTLLSPVRRPPNPRGTLPRVPRLRSNHNTQRPLHRILMQHTVLLLFKKLPPKNCPWIAPPFYRLLPSKSPV